MKRKEIFTIVIVLIVVAAFAVFFNWFSPLNPNTKSSKQIACEDSGGYWLKFDVPGKDPECLPRLSDEGKKCTDSEQCEGYCSAPTFASPGDAVEGKCSRYRTQICTSRVSDGVFTGIMCH